MVNEVNLCDVVPNKVVKVASIDCEDTVVKRLYDFGLIAGTDISPVFVSPLGNPIAYEFRGNIVAIRNEDAVKISVI